VKQNHFGFQSPRKGAFSFVFLLILIDSRREKKNILITWNIVKISCLLWHHECMMQDIKNLIGMLIVIPLIIGVGVPLAVTVAAGLAGGFTYVFYLIASFFMS
jgi:hypothetical protein